MSKSVIFMMAIAFAINYTFFPAATQAAPAQTSAATQAADPDTLTVRCWDSGGCLATWPDGSVFNIYRHGGAEFPTSTVADNGYPCRVHSYPWFIWWGQMDCGFGITKWGYN